MRWRWPFGRRKPEERYTLSSGGWGVGYLGGLGGPVSVPAAESLSAVCSCVELISGAIASLPASLVVDTPNGTTDAPASAAAWRILRRPNEWQSWPAWMAWNVASILLRGNSLSRIDLDQRGAVTGLTPIAWAWVMPAVVAGPKLIFDVTMRTPESDAWGLSGTRLLSDEVLHIRARSDSGLIGRSVLSRAAGAVAEGIEIAATASGLWRNGMRPSGVLTAPSYLTPEQRNRKNEWVSEYASSVNAGRVPLLEGGWKFEPTSLNSVDAEFLASRRFSVEEIARLFCVPAPLIQLPENSTPADMATFSVLLTQFALQPLITLITDEFDHSVLPSGQHLVIDADGLARGSFASSVSAIVALVQSGVITPNDGRTALGWPEIEGGDVLRPTGAPSWPADATGLPSMGPKPGPRPPDGLPAPGTHQNQGRGNGAAHA